MNESTFLCLLYIFMLTNRNNSKVDLKSFRKHVITVFKDSYDVRDFMLRFLSDSLELSEVEYRIRRNFVAFIRENNEILGY